MKQRQIVQVLFPTGKKKKEVVMAEFYCSVMEIELEPPDHECIGPECECVKKGSLDKTKS